MATFSLLLALVTLSLVGAWLLAWPLLGAWSRLVRRRPALARFNVVALSVPALAGLVLAAGAVWPAHAHDLLRFSCHCHPAGSADLVHLCLAHPAGALPLLPGVVFLLVWTGWRTTARAREVLQRLLAARRLLKKTTWQKDPRHGVLVGDLGSPNAFTAGLVRTRVLVDRTWWRLLSSTERQVVAAHEKTHARCGDPLTQAVGWLLSCLAPEKLCHPLLAGWLDRAEQRADLTAAQAVGDPLAVAELLTRQARMGDAPGLVPAFTSGGIEARVRTLLIPLERPPSHGSDLRLALPLTVTALASAALLGPNIHATLEHLLHLFK